jgi:hypothetical protein
MGIASIVLYKHGGLVHTEDVRAEVLKAVNAAFSSGTLQANFAGVTVGRLHASGLATFANSVAIDGSGVIDGNLIVGTQAQMQFQSSGPIVAQSLRVASTLDARETTAASRFLQIQHPGLAKRRLVLNSSTPLNCTALVRFWDSLAVQLWEYDLAPETSQSYSASFVRRHDLPGAARYVLAVNSPLNATAGDEYAQFRESLFPPVANTHNLANIDGTPSPLLQAVDPAALFLLSMLRARNCSLH